MDIINFIEAQKMEAVPFTEHAEFLKNSDGTYNIRIKIPFQEIKNKRFIYVQLMPEKAGAYEFYKTYLYIEDYEILYHNKYQTYDKNNHYINKNEYLLKCHYVIIIKTGDVIRWI